MKPRMWIVILAMLLLGWGAAPELRAQDASEQSTETETSADGPDADGPPDHLASPNATYATFKQAYDDWKTSGRDAARDRAISALDLSAYSGVSIREDAVRERILREVGEVLTRHEYWQTPYLADREKLKPGQTAVTFRLRDYETEDEPLRIVLGADGAWRIGPSTVKRLEEEIYDELFIDADPIQRALDRAGMRTLLVNRFLGLKYYQWIGLFFVVLFGVTLDFFVRLVVRGIARRYLKRNEDRATPTDTPKMIKKAARPFGIMAGAVLVFLLIPLLNLNLEAEGILRLAAKTAGLIAFVWAAYRVTDLVAEFFARRAAGTSTPIDDLLIPLLRKATKIFIAAFGLVFLADAFDLPIMSLIAGLGIGGLAVAFAAKDTIENLFGSVAVLLDQPFAVGDWVAIGDVEGVVEELGFRSTRVRTFYNSVVTVPNATLVRANVDNYGRRQFRRFKADLRLAYDTPADDIEAFCEAVRELIRRHPFTRKDFYIVTLNSFGEHSLNVLLYTFFSTPDWAIEMRERQRFMLDVLRIASRMNIEFATHTHTVHLRKPEDMRTPGDPVAESAAIARGREVADSLIADAEWKDDRPGPVTF